MIASNEDCAHRETLDLMRSLNEGFLYLIWSSEWRIPDEWLQLYKRRCMWQLSFYNRTHVSLAVLEGLKRVSQHDRKTPGTLLWFLIPFSLTVCKCLIIYSHLFLSIITIANIYLTEQIVWKVPGVAEQVGAWHGTRRSRIKSSNHDYMIPDVP